MNAIVSAVSSRAARSWRQPLTLLCAAWFVAGCPSGNPSAGSGPAATAGSANKVIIRGSNTIGEELAPQLIAAFKKDHPGIAFELEPKATGYGMAALRAGQCDIAAASRAAIEEELELTKASGITLNETILGAYSVAVVVNAANPVANLTKEQVHDIFTGKVTNWKDVGGPDAAIQLYIRDPISGTHLGFKEIAMKNEAYAPHPNLKTNYTAIIQAVAADPNGIGYSGIEMAQAGGVKLLAIDGVAPSTATVNAGKYPYARVLRLYTNQARESQATKDFLEFATSKRGQEILTQMGFTPKS